MSSQTRCNKTCLDDGSRTMFVCQLSSRHTGAHLALPLKLEDAPRRDALRADPTEDELMLVEAPQ